jgi:hypothetical protein
MPNEKVSLSYRFSNNPDLRGADVGDKEGIVRVTAIPLPAAVLIDPLPGLPRTFRNGVSSLVSKLPLFEEACKNEV